MRYSFSIMRDCLRADLSDRDTVAETDEFIRALGAEVARTGCQRILIYVRTSRAIFQVEKYGISEYLRLLGANQAMRVALMADSLEARAVHEYVEVLARQRGANVRSFTKETDAVNWLRVDLNKTDKTE